MGFLNWPEHSSVTSIGLKKKALFAIVTVLYHVCHLRGLRSTRAPSSLPVAGGAARPHRQSEGLTWLVSVLQEVSAPHTQSRHTPSAMAQEKPPRYRFSSCLHVHGLKSKHPLPPSFYYLSHLLTWPLKSLKTPQREETPRGKLAPYQGNESSSHIFVMAIHPSGTFPNSSVIWPL